MNTFNSELFHESVRQCAVRIYQNSLVIKGEDMEYEVRKALLETKKPKGVYFLISKCNKLLYVGKSENLLDRLVNHVTGKGGNSSRYVGLVKEIRVAIFEDGTGSTLTRLERTFIMNLKPAFNGGNGKGGSTIQFGYRSLYPELYGVTEDDLIRLINSWPSIEVTS